MDAESRTTVHRRASADAESRTESAIRREPTRNPQPLYADDEPPHSCRGRTATTVQM
ncbi:hypothetical protein FH972_017084 [Carpinus fangiana]|uniref:Uncharacterized protein n=1 Tax=Carpinus fangiana TaxID=176857 RepID=A0A5N6RHX0_9ROSI|nr:hypothetical protein FH972_017084 [Carpinus fangiana]